MEVFKKNIAQKIILFLIIFSAVVLWILFTRSYTENNKDIYDDFNLYKKEVGYRIQSAQLDLTTSSNDLTKIKNYHYRPVHIKSEISSLFDIIDKKKDKNDWRPVLKEELSNFWLELPPVSEDLSSEQWMHRNLDRYIIIRGFELLTRPLKVKLTNAILEIKQAKKRKQLMRVWREINNPVYSIEYPRYDLLGKSGKVYKVYRDRSSLWKTFRQPRGIPLIIAHRGGFSDYPENSLASFEHAYLRGYDGIECDLRLSRDGVVFVLHDDNLERMTGLKSRVGDLSNQQLLDLRLRNPLDLHKSSNESPLMLETLLKEYGGKMLLWLEMKPDGGYDLPDKVGDLLEQYNLANQVIVSSFSPNMLEPLRLRFPELILSYEFGVFKEADIERLLSLPDKHRLVLSADHPEIITPEILSRLVSGGIITSSYTPNRFDAIQSALDHKVRLIQTGRPERAFMLRKIKFSDMHG